MVRNLYSRPCGGFIRRQLLTGNEIILKAALAAGADAFFGYPITPTTEILTGWTNEAAENKDLVFLQTEDEMAAGFGVLGAVLGGKKAWTATAGVGHVLMQDPLSMAEAMKLPFVVYIGQRGGPSTGTVIYSQQELNLARFGGNGEGLRIVIGPSTLQELYDFTVRAFDWAWRYRLPVIILGDGYLSKMTGEVILKPAGKVTKPQSYVANEVPVNLRNCYSLEDELAEELTKDIKQYGKLAAKVEKAEEVGLSDAGVVVFAWGTVGHAAESAVKSLRSKGKKAGLFRPITLRPFPVKAAKAAAKKAKKILICDSSAGQFGRLVTESLFGIDGVKVERFYKPAEGIIAEEIEEKLEDML